MCNGYAGKMLFVNPSEGSIREEALSEKLCRDSYRRRSGLKDS